MRFAILFLLFSVISVTAARRVLLKYRAVSQPTICSTNWVTNLWSFTGGTDLSDGGLSSQITFSYNSGDNFVLFTNATKNVTSSEIGITNATGSTWETWGVTANATVLNVQLVAWQYKLANNAKLNSNTNRCRVINNAGSSVTSGYLFDTNMPTTIDASFQNGAIEGIKAVNAGDSASTTGVRLELEYGLDTAAGGGSADDCMQLDEYKLAIQYYTCQ